MLKAITTVLEQFEQSDLDEKGRLEYAIRQLLPLCKQIPHPAQGQTLLRWQILAKVAASNLNLVKWFESHLDALSILNELQYPKVKSGLWAVWAAEGSPQPLKFEHGDCTGLKNWCSGASIVDHGLMTYKDENNQSQLLIVNMHEQGIEIRPAGWHALGMQYTQTSSIYFENVKAEKVGAPNAYLNRAGFWHGAAGVAACWFGAALRLVGYLIQAAKTNPHDFKQMYLGEVMTAVETTRQLFYALASKLDETPHLSHELEIRILRAQTESAAELILKNVGKALGARPYCEDKQFAQLSTDLPVFLRQSHAAFDLKRIGELVSEESNVWQL